MKIDEFWSAELGVRMGPLVLGTEYELLLKVLRDHRIDVDRLMPARSGKLSVPEIHTQFLFSGTYPRTLDRIDVDDERLRFGPLAVIGKRVHEIIGLFKVSRKETLWCSIEANSQTSDLYAKGNTTAQSRELLAHGTIWIPSLGLGLTLRDGLIATVHLCDPAHAPRNGSGPWTKEQQLLSEVRELPAISTATTISTASTKRHRKFIRSSLIHLSFVASMGTLIWWAILLQQKWDAAPEVPAVVVALDRPVLPENITVSFSDSNGTEHRQSLGYMQFAMSPKLGDEINVRYLPDAPDKVLGPGAIWDVGLNAALPYGIGILAIYSFLQLVVFGGKSFRSRRRSFVS